jgi:hypothetical protein
MEEVFEQTLENFNKAARDFAEKYGFEAAEEGIQSALQALKLREAVSRLEKVD